MYAYIHYYTDDRNLCFIFSFRFTPVAHSVRRMPTIVIVHCTIHQPSQANHLHIPFRTYIYARGMEATVWYDGIKRGVVYSEERLCEYGRTLCTYNVCSLSMNSSPLSSPSRTQHKG